MATKVEISGLNTSNLPKITNSESIELMKKIKEGDVEAKNYFIYANLRLVLSVVQRFSNKKENADDLFQVGCVGLIKAINNFDQSFNLKFSTYAVPMIIGEIRRFLRDNTSVRISRSLRDIAYKALQSREKLMKLKDAEVTTDEIAEDLNLPYREVAFALDAISDPISMFDPVYNDGSETVRVQDQIGDNKNNQEEWIEDIALKDALKKLSKREKQIILMRYYMGKTQVEVSEEVGISQAQVSRLEKTAIYNMKKNF